MKRILFTRTRSKSTALKTSVLVRRVLTLAAFLLPYGTSAASGQEIKIVSPNVYEDVDAPGATTEACCPWPFRYQRLFPAEDFSDLPNGQGLLTAIALRPDGDAPASQITSDFGRVTVDVSTTSVSAEDMHDIVDLNIGSPVTRVIDRDDLVFESNNVGPVGGPKEFDFVITLDEPFFYDTTQGNLLFDWKMLDGIFGSNFGDMTQSENWDTTQGNARIGFPYDAQEGKSEKSHIMQFMFTVGPPGDFNADSKLHSEDLDLLAAEIQNGFYEDRFDLNADGVVDFEDRRYWVEDLKSTFLGDANLDGTVDAGDLNNLALNWQSPSTATWAMGDFTGDGNTNAADLNLLALNWQSGPQAAISGASVPEPTSALLLAVGLMMGFTSFRHRRA